MHSCGLALAAAVSMTAAAAAADPPEGLVLHFPFSQAPTGRRIEDAAGRQHHGTATRVDWTEHGRVGGGLELGATNSFITVPAAPALAPSSNLTVAVWFRTSADLPVRRTLLELRGEAGFALQILGGPAESQRGRLRASFHGHSCVSDTTVTDGVWTHSALVVEGDALRLYVDGRLQADTATLEGAVDTMPGELTLGLNASTPRPAETGRSFEGRLDEFMMFDRALPAEAILALVDSAPTRTTRAQFDRLVAQLEDLYERGLLTRDFVDAKIQEYREDL